MGPLGGLAQLARASDLPKLDHFKVFRRSSVRVRYPPQIYGVLYRRDLTTLHVVQKNGVRFPYTPQIKQIKNFLYICVMRIHKDENIVSFTNVKLPYGWMGNMIQCPITYNNTEWFHTEGLFQALRFDPKEIHIISELRREKNPMKAKMESKTYADQRSVVPLSDEDIDLMKLCVDLKFDQHPELYKQLVETGDSFIIEDVTSRMSGTGTFWGMGLVGEYWIGENVLGNILMEKRKNYPYDMFRNLED